ncbi:hypothetical protein RAS2_03950 [Phycisphaerae bacterium RAS2]|nr:hypothetical protein RAS2_03950 [Phycisphaerae bacterium RAS2]
MIQIDWKPSNRILRNFGLIGVVAFSAFAGLIRYDFGWFDKIPGTPPVIYTLLGLAGYCGLFALVAPPALKWLYILLTVVSFPIGFVVSYVVVLVMFFLVITPIAMVFKLIGRDPMNRRFNPSLASYWIARTPPATAKRYFQQF